jgi:hypothetical protein
VNLPTPFEIDFLQYWAAIRLANQGANPYDPALMLSLQQSVGLPYPNPTMMWNPPWLLLFLAPMLQFSPDVSLALWRIVSAALAGAALFIFCAADNRRYLRGWLPAVSLLLLATSLPFWHGILLGNIHALLLLGFALAVYGRTAKNSWATALGLLVMTIKPHIFYLVGIGFIFDALRQRDFTSLRRALLLLGAAVVLTQIIWPGVFLDWLSVHLYGAPGTYIRTAQWRVPTLMLPVRALLLDTLDFPPGFAMIILPGITAIGFGVWCLRSRDFSLSPTALAYLLVLSYLTSPYGWLYDQLMLLPAIVMALARSAEATPRYALTGAIIWSALQLIGINGRGLLFTMEHHYLWLPICCAALIFALEHLRTSALQRHVKPSAER